jgi:hypothetical protein
MAWSQQQQDAMKSILANWHKLSRGDISTICVQFRKPGEIMTVDGTPHATFWQNLVKIGWAEGRYTLVDPSEVPYGPLQFRLTYEGIGNLPRFLIAYDLLNMGACTPSSDIHPEHAEESLALRVVGLISAGLLSLFSVLLAAFGAGFKQSLAVYALAVVVAVLSCLRYLSGQPRRALLGISVGLLVMTTVFSPAILQQLLSALGS